MSENEEQHNKNEEQNEEMATAPKRTSKHLIKPAWLRIPLKILMWVVIVVLLLPIALYIPAVQDFAVGTATKMVKEKTGMDIGIGRLRLSFPLDLHLKDVYVVEASGDTMVRAGEAIADVKLMPLLKLDVRLNRLQLNDGYYRMTAPDSSMIMKINAGFLEVDDKSYVNIGTSLIDLNKVRLRDGRLSLFMDVWKSANTPQDTTKSSSSAPFKILAKDLDIENFSFGMSMLPTIDTLDVAVRHVAIKDAKVDLGENLVRWKLASICGGNFTYLTPTAEYVKTHPAPPSKPSTGPPMRIMGDSIAVDSLQALYGVQGAKPLPGFDPSYLKFSGVTIGMRDFYNESSTVRLPLTRLAVRERCGLNIISGKGTVGIDSVGLKIDGLSVRTPYTALDATANVSFAMMAMNTSAPVQVNATGHVGMPDVDAFMPALKTYTSMVPARKPLDFGVKASGSLADILIERLDVGMSGVMSLKASGNARNALDYKKMVAKVKFDGSLSDPTLADKIAQLPEVKIPAFTIEGEAQANGLNYGADFMLRSDAGDVDAKGHVALTPENYEAEVETVGLDVGRFVPQAGVGRITASIHAKGHGFNPLSGVAVTDAIVNVASVEYNKNLLHDIRLAANLSEAGNLTLLASSSNPGLDFDLNGNGAIHADDYTFDIAANLRDVNLQRLGLMDSICYGSGQLTLKGNAQPDKWIYDVALDASALEWHLPGQYIHLPDGVAANIKSDFSGTSVNINSMLTSLDFRSESGLQQLIKSFTTVGDMAMRQVQRKSIAIDSISSALPRFNLDIAASGRGLMGQFLQPMGMGLDTLFMRLTNDSIMTGSVNALNYTSASVNLDTLTLALNQRGQLFDYKMHLGNRKGTLDEFAKVNVNGYLGENRVSAFFNQWNIKGDQGYRIGLTAAMQDSVVTAHITPLKSTIAYMPWTFNNDNFVDFNLYNKHIEANLKAQSAESSILARTQKDETGGEELYVNIDNVHIQDFLNMFALAPSMKGDLNADMHVDYEAGRFSGKGNIALNNFIYEKTKVGSFNLDLDAGYGFDGNTEVTAGLRINGEKAMSAYARLLPDKNEGMKPDSIGLSLTRFPLKVANPFLGETVSLAGYVNGDLNMEGSFAEPVLNGAIAFDSVSAYVPMAGANLQFREDMLSVVDNVVTFPDFKIYGANKNPIVLNGTVNAKKFSNILFDLTADADNFQLVKSDSRSKADLFGKVFLNLDAAVTGPMNRLDINASLNMLGSTDATYRLNMEPAQLTAQSDQDVVKFVNFNDTVQVVQADSIVQSPLNMRINAKVTISPGTHLTVLLSNNGTDKVELSPTANLTYTQNYMGDMALNGTVVLGNGYARYSVPVIGEKMFTFDPVSSVRFNGSVTDPVLNIIASDEVKANVKSGDNSRLVNFFVTAKITNSLKNLQAAFDLSTNDDLSIQNELQSMSADQRQTQAMNLLLYGQYMGQNTKANAASGNMLYSFLESQLNSWAAKNIRGVDLSFGVNQYDKTTNGVTNTETSYSYQVSKTLFNNRFKVLVGGNYSTDAADDEIANNLISDVAVEYMLKQTQTMNMSVKLFRHIGFESILEGEITEMGGAFVFKRKLDNLKSLFRFHRRKKKQEEPENPIRENVMLKPDSTESPQDSIMK